MKEYTLSVHYKQGDDLNHRIVQAGHDDRLGLEHWSQQLFQAAEHIKMLADMFKGKELSIWAYTHHISFEGEAATLKRAAALRLLQESEQDDEEDHF